MNVRFVGAMVRRESRAAARRLGLYVGSIALGVAAVVAINAFRAEVETSVRQHARSLLGADLELTSRTAFSDTLQAVLDSTARGGTPVSFLTSFASMVLAERSGQSRLVQVRAIEGGYPYYGDVTTDPPGKWMAFRRGARVLVDPGLLIQLDARTGDTLLIGDLRAVIAGTVTNLPGDVAIRAAIGPRVYLPAAALAATHLLQRGSRASYAAYLRIGNAGTLNAFLAGHRTLFRAEHVRSNTVDERERDLTRALDRLGRFLGLVGLAALLLGGVGVGSAVRVFVRSRLDAAAVLRCLGAQQRAIVTIFLSLVIALGAAGALAGVVLGTGLQALLPHVLADFLPLDVPFAVSWPTVWAGLGVGIGVSVLFGLIPLLAVRGVPPLRALRRAFDPAPVHRDPYRLAAYLLLGVGVVALCLWQAPRRDIGFGFAAAIAVTTLVLWITGSALVRATRRFVPHRATYVVRQGVANLFRPQNQTIAVTLALGFGVFLIGTLYVVEHALIRQFSVEARPDRPNLVMFDIQPDQRAGVRALLARHGLPTLQETPIVTARIAAINGVPVDTLRAQTGRRDRWALRREYRNTYRDTLVASETLVAGRWWERGATVAGSGRPAGVSLEQDIAGQLGVKLGDRITWDVQGVRIPTRVTSLRRVDWARFEPNFYAVFEPGALEGAPAMYVILTRAGDPTVTAAFQRDLVRAYPNVSAIDLALVQRTLDGVLGRVTLAVRFMALFSIGCGILILVGAITASRLQRLREIALLATLGARARQIRGILASEYIALGALGGLTGALLAAAAGWAALHFVFEIPARLPVAALAVLWIGTASLTVIVGMLTGREVLRRPPLEALRELGE